MDVTKARIPVILDTDIGDDIDDTWAIAMMLKSPELDVKLITTAVGQQTWRAKLVARLLEVAGRTDIPIGLGVALPGKIGAQGAWGETYDLSRYPGKVHPDGVQAMIDTILRSAGPVTLICIGPMANIGEALRREPRIAQKVRFVGMHGSVRRGYGGSERISPEYNVKMYTPDCQAAFTADWPVTITPLDTCGLIRLAGEKYKAVYHCKDPLVQALLENYRVWAQKVSWTKVDVEAHSSTLFDTAAVYLALCEELVTIEELPIRVTDDGHTLIEPGAKVVRCATGWKNLGAYEDFLVQRLIG